MNVAINIFTLPCRVEYHRGAEFHIWRLKVNGHSRTLCRVVSPEGKTLPLRAFPGRPSVAKMASHMPKLFPQQGRLFIEIEQE
ncbi:MAG: hypothetical protein DRI61_06250 [Chloroflexi bacterium]|nr:MAG: hypothetical protein DRI61_06250 [Chloroflexota bacterium]